MTGLVRDHPEVAAYLARLDAAASVLPPDRRAELVGSIEEHLTDALAAAGSDDAATVHEVLARLGSPEDIVADEPTAAPSGTTSPADAASGPWGPLEIAAVLLLTVGYLLVVGPVAGLVLAWISPRWTRREKWVATVWTVLPPLLALGAGLAALLFFAGTSSVSEVGPAVTVSPSVSAAVVGGTP